MGAGPRRGEPDGEEQSGGAAGDRSPRTHRLGLAGLREAPGSTDSRAAVGAPRGLRETRVQRRGGPRALLSPEFVAGPGGSPSLGTAFLTTPRSLEEGELKAPGGPSVVFQGQLLPDNTLINLLPGVW